VVDWNAHLPATSDGRLPESFYWPRIPPSATTPFAPRRWWNGLRTASAIFGETTTHESHHAAGEDDWVAHTNEVGSRTLLSSANGCLLAGIFRVSRARSPLCESAPAYRAKCAEVAAKGYEGFDLQ